MNTLREPVIHLRALLDPETPVCREVVLDGDTLGGEREGNCSTCLEVRSGAWITSFKRGTR